MVFSKVEDTPQKQEGSNKGYKANHLTCSPQPLLQSSQQQYTVKGQPVDVSKFKVQIDADETGEERPPVLQSRLLNGNSYATIIPKLSYKVDSSANDPMRKQEVN